MSAPEKAKKSEDNRPEPRGLSAWIAALALAALWCVLPLWEAAFIAYHAPGIYWLFVAQEHALSAIVILLIATAAAAAITVQRLRTPIPPGDLTPEQRQKRGDLRAGGYLGAIVFGLLLVRVAIAAVGLLPALDQHVDEVTTGQHVYYLGHHTTPPGAGSYSFVQCDSMGLWCAQLQDIHTDETPGDAAGVPGAEMHYDIRPHTISVIEDGKTYYTYTPGG